MTFALWMNRTFKQVDRTTTGSDHSPYFGYQDLFVTLIRVRTWPDD